MATLEVRQATMEDAILHGFKEFLRGRMEEIIERKKKEASEEIDRAVRQEVANVVLTLGSYVRIEHLHNELVIRIEDERKDS